MMTHQLQVYRSFTLMFGMPFTELIHAKILSTGGP